MSRTIRAAGVSAALLTAGTLLAATAPPAAAAGTLVAVVRVVNGTGGSQLVYTAQGDVDNVILLTDAGQTVILDDIVPIKAGPGCAAVPGDTTQVACTRPLGWSQLRITAGAGDDSVNNATGHPMRADGGAGNDELTGGLGADILIGGPGDDQLSGIRGAAVLDGGADATAAGDRCWSFYGLRDTKIDCER